MILGTASLEHKPSTLKLKIMKKGEKKECEKEKRDLILIHQYSHKIENNGRSIYKLSPQQGFMNLALVKQRPSHVHLIFYLTITSWLIRRNPPPKTKLLSRSRIRSILTQTFLSIHPSMMPPGSPWVDNGRIWLVMNGHG
jgi:hypothetical protein